MAIILAMHFWNALPLFRLIIPFTIGIIFSNLIYFDGILYVIYFVFVTLFFIQSKRVSYKFRWLFGALASLFVLGIGAWLNPTSLDFKDKQYFVNSLVEENTLLLELIEEPQVKVNSYKAIAKVLAVNENTSKGQLLIYLDKELNSLHYGSCLLARCKPRNVSNPKNPLQFNYRKFLFHRNISHQTYLSKEDVVILDEIGGSVFMKKIISLRQKLLGLLHIKDLTFDQSAISSALLLGYKQDMGADLKQAFSQTGVIHVLAVSGLHVGIIYLLLNSMLNFMDRRNSLKFIKLVIILTSLWAYAIITALSPSVLRATVMFSFLAIGFVLDRSTNINNSLAASAFVLLFINPHYIYEAGFQLSYLAVLGIVSIYPKLYGLFRFRLSVLDSIWQLFCVSFSAQLATFPMAIYYFHQFPNYFIVANLLIVPLVPLIIYSGLGFLIFNEFIFLREAFLSVLKILVELLQNIVREIETWPHSISDFLYFDTLDVLLIYAIIGTLLLAIYLRQKVWLIGSLLLILTFQLTHILFQEKQNNKHKLIFYSVNKHTAFGLVSNGEGVFFMDNSLLLDRNKQSFSLYNHWSFLGLNDAKVLNLDSNLEASMVWKNGCHIQLANKRMLWVNEDFKILESKTPISLDYCLISRRVSLQEILKVYEPKEIILDASLPHYLEKRLQQDCRDLQLPFYSLKNNGALLVDLRN